MRRKSPARAVGRSDDKMTYAWGDSRRYNSYAGYFRRLFGERVQKLSVDAGFTCPNRDGTIAEGGCTFCNNGAFTPSYCPTMIASTML